MTEYNAKSCDALQKPYYKPVEVAIRWCGLINHEAEIISQLNPGEMIPAIGQFPKWPCLRVNTEKILDAIAHKELAYGRDGKPVAPDEHVNKTRLTVRHNDLRGWMQKF